MESVKVSPGRVGNRADRYFPPEMECAPMADTDGARMYISDIRIVYRICSSGEVCPQSALKRLSPSSDGMFYSNL
jgi:hypothetical protein